MPHAGEPPKLESSLVWQGSDRFSMKNQAPKFPLPKPIELAKLAAILRPKSKPESALKVAMELYVEAVFFYRECTSKSSEDLIAEFASQPRWLPLGHEQMERRDQSLLEDTLELNPTKHTDSAREFLSERGLPLKTPRAVLNNIDKAIGETAGVIAQHKTVLNRKETYNIPKFMLEHVLDYAKRHRRETKLKSWHKRKKKRQAVLKKSGKKNF